MAKFKYDILNEELLTHLCFSAYDDGDKGSYADDGYLDEDDYNEDADDYESDGEGEYDDEEYDDAEYDDADGEYDDDAEYDEDGEEYDDADYDEDAQYDEDGEYVDEDEYGDEEEYGEDEEDLGYNPNVFKRLNNEDSDEYDDDYDGEEYDEGEYEDEESQDQSYDDADENEFDESADDGWLAKVKNALGNDYVQYALCALIPPLGAFLVWRNKGFSNQKKWILTGIAAVCFVIWMIICWPKGSNDPTSTPTNTASANPFNVVTANTSTPEPVFGQDDQTSADNSTDVTPATTPHASTGDGTATTVANGSDIVWTTNANLYYHTKSDCGGMTGATSMSLEAAVQRGKTACPECAGGTSQFADQVTATTYYATTKGTWYHTDPTCQGMTGASVVSESAAIAAGKTACPVCIGYYGTQNGTWYHSLSNCQGMQNAVTKTKAEWEALGKTACPNCLSGNKNTVKSNTSVTETQVFCTSTGTYFHTLSDCSGMKGATQTSISKAVSSGKKACVRCVSPSRVYVFATQGGTYYHTKATCSGMTGAQYITAKQAISAGKKACPNCNAKNLSTSTTSTGSTSTASTSSGTVVATTLGNNTAASDATTYVYATKNGTYYHTKSNCSGMKGATRVTYAQAISAGKKACPTCVKASEVKVYATAGGKYYHTKANCSGMSGAVEVTISKALSAGKTACPTCAKALGNATASKSTTAATGTNASTDQNAANSTKATAVTNVYITVGSASGSYYHKSAKCSAQGFSNGVNVTLEYALGHGYKACPSCQPPAKIAS